MKKISALPIKDYSHLKLNMDRDSAYTISLKREDTVREISKLINACDFKGLKYLMDELKPSRLEIKMYLSEKGNVPLSLKHGEAMMYEFSMEFAQDIVEYRARLEKFIATATKAKIAIMSYAYYLWIDGKSEFTAKMVREQTNIPKSTIESNLRSLCNTGILSSVKYNYNRPYEYGLTIYGQEICKHIIEAKEPKNTIEDEVTYLNSLMEIHSQFVRNMGNKESKE